MGATGARLRPACAGRGHGPLLPLCFLIANGYDPRPRLNTG